MGKLMLINAAEEEDRIAILDNGAATADAVGSDPAISYLPAVGNVGFGAGHNRLMKDAFAAGAAQADDITMMMLRFLGNSAPRA